MSVNDQSADESLRGNGGWFDQAPWSGLELRGADRARFLNGLVTCDVKALVPGTGTYGFFTTAQGKVLADVIVLAHSDSLSLQLAPEVTAEIRAHLEKYLIADRVSVHGREDVAVVRGIGAVAERALARLLVEGWSTELPEAPWSHREFSWEGIEVRAVRSDRLGAPAVALEAPAAAAEGLVAGLPDLGLRPAGPAVLDRLRIEAGIALYGVDFGREHFPQETGAEAEAVSYTKGCYLGQEVVARIHYRGGVNRGLRGLRFETASPPPLGTELLADGHPVGRVTSGVAVAGGAIGLSILHKRGWEIGQRLNLEGTGTAVVTEAGIGRLSPALDSSG